MVDSTLVSVVIPCYNAACFLGEAIESALRQTYPCVDVVVIDDGSTDDSIEVLRSFGNRIRWESGPNCGACAARNRGVEIANGALIQFLDADDLLLPDKVRLQVDELHRTDADVVFCDAEVYESGNLRGQHDRAFDGGDPLRFVLSGALTTPQPLHRRKTFQSVGGFREDLPCAQERDLHLRLASAGFRFHRLPEVLCRIRRVPGSLSSSIHVLDQHPRILWPVYRELTERGELSDERARAFAALLATDAREYLRHGLRERAVDYFEQAHQMHAGGGIEEVYDWPARVLRRFFGMDFVERLSQVRRKATLRRKADKSVGTTERSTD